MTLSHTTNRQHRHRHNGPQIPNTREVLPLGHGVQALAPPPETEPTGHTSQASALDVVE